MLQVEELQICNYQTMLQYANMDIHGSNLEVSRGFVLNQPMNVV